MNYIFDNYKYEKDINPAAELCFSPKMSEIFKEFSWNSVAIKDGDLSYPIHQSDTVQSDIVELFEAEFIKHYDKFKDKETGSVLALNMLRMGFTPVLGEVLLKDDNKGDEFKVKVTSGVNIIIGASNSGKSTLTRTIASQLQIGVVNYSECTIPAVPNRESLAKVINDFIKSDRAMLIIDSMSEFVYARGREAATTGGTSTEFLSLLTTLSSHLIMINKALIITLNTYAISSEALFDSYLGRVPTIFHLISRGKLTYSTRVNFASRDVQNISWTNKVLDDERKEFSEAHQKKGQLGEGDEYTFGSVSPINSSISFSGILKKK